MGGYPETDHGLPPQTNMTERVNRTLKIMIAAFVGHHHLEWDKWLPEFWMGLNTAVHETMGSTPAMLGGN